VSAKTRTVKTPSAAARFPLFSDNGQPVIVFTSAQTTRRLIARKSLAGPNSRSACGFFADSSETARVAAASSRHRRENLADLSPRVRLCRGGASHLAIEREREREREREENNRKEAKRFKIAECIVDTLRSRKSSMRIFASSRVAFLSVSRTNGLLSLSAKVDRIDLRLSLARPPANDSSFAPAVAAQTISEWPKKASGKSCYLFLA